MDIQEIKENFERLKRQDRGLRRFGASGHKYVSYPISTEEIEKFENKFEIALSSFYRNFLTEIGYGTGPYYGIWSLKKIQDEIDCTLIELKEEENIEISPAKPFPFIRKDIEKLNEKVEKHLADYGTIPFLEEMYPCDGCIPICTHGCTFWSCLVITGELRGSVWDVGCPVGYEGGWNPSFYSSITSRYYNLSFEEWIENWIKETPVYNSSPPSNFGDGIFDFVRRLFK